jgi:hypothetical protein
MTEARPNFASLEPTHSRAIRHEIGERLRLALDRDRSPVPARLRGLLDRFEKMDRGEARHVEIGNRSVGTGRNRRQRARY